MYLKFFETKPAKQEKQDRYNIYKSTSFITTMFWTFSFIFVVVVFLYFHVQHQYKTSDVLEIYEIDYVSNVKLQEICELKQPVLFYLPVFESSPVLSVQNIKDIRDYYKYPIPASIESLQLSSSSAQGLLDTDTKGIFYSDRNRVESLGLEIDMSLKPSFVVHKQFDILFGSRNANTPFMFHTESRRFLSVSQKAGKTGASEKTAGIQVKMIPWKFKSQFEPIQYDYEHYEWWSPLQEKETPCIDFLVKPEYTLFIPAYWWYSIQFMDVHCQVNSATYSTPANLLSNSRHLALYLLQQQNTTQFFLKPLKEISQEEVVSNADISSASVGNTEIDNIAESILSDLKG